MKTKLKWGIFALWNKKFQKYWTSHSWKKAEKLNLNVSSIGGCHIALKTFQSQWSSIPCRELFQKNSIISCTAHGFHQHGNKQAEKSKCPRVHQLALLPEALECRASPMAPAAYQSDLPLTLRLHQGSRPQWSLSEWIKGLGTESWQKKRRPLKSGTISFRQMNEQSSVKQDLSDEFGAVWFVLTEKRKTES